MHTIFLIVLDKRLKAYSDKTQNVRQRKSKKTDMCQQEKWQVNPLKKSSVGDVDKREVTVSLCSRKGKDHLKMMLLIDVRR